MKIFGKGEAQKVSSERESVCVSERERKTEERGEHEEC